VIPLAFLVGGEVHRGGIGGSEPSAPVPHPDPLPRVSRATEPPPRRVGEPLTETLATPQPRLLRMIQQERASDSGDGGRAVQ
jgi:hypothetical protein